MAHITNMTHRIGYLIPEFPGQTHAFFIRERDELKKLGVETQIISTQRPVGGAGAATHSWASREARNTVYLFPLSLTEVLASLLEIFLAGPLAWARCTRIILGKSDMRAGERLKMVPLLLVAARLKRFCRSEALEHVHIHSCANSANLGLLARLIGGPTYSVTLHGEIHDYGSNQENKWHYASFGIVITRELMREVKRQLAHVQLPPIFLAPMGVQVERFQRTSPYVPPTAGSTLRLVSCGRLHFVKAHDDLIRAVASMKDRGISATLSICGSTDTLSATGDYFQSLKSLSSELGVSDSIVFLGSVPEERVIAELESAHFFCLASLKEPLGVAIMEAMAMEVPVIVAHSEGVAEMVDDGVDGVLVPPRAPEQFAQAIVDLASQPDTALAISRAGRIKIATQFHSGISAARIASGVTEATATGLAPKGSTG